MRQQPGDNQSISEGVSG